MASKKVTLAWRVAWPLAIMFAASGVVAYASERALSAVPQESFLGATLGGMCSMIICAGYLGTSLVVARRYKRLVGRPVSRTIKACLYSLLVLGIILLCWGLIGLAITISGHFLWG